MKKSILFAAGAILMASCANEDLVREPSAPGGTDQQVAIDFNRRTKNQTRATTTESNLEAKYLEFGVHAVKAADQAGIDLSATSENVV